MSGIVQKLQRLRQVCLVRHQSYMPISLFSSFTFYESYVGVVIIITNSSRWFQWVGCFTLQPDWTTMLFWSMVAEHHHPNHASTLFYYHQWQRKQVLHMLEMPHVATARTLILHVVNIFQEMILQRRVTSKLFFIVMEIFLSQDGGTLHHVLSFVMVDFQVWYFFRLIKWHVIFLEKAVVITVSLFLFQEVKMYWYLGAVVLPNLPWGTVICFILNHEHGERYLQEILTPSKRYLNDLPVNHLLSVKFLSDILKWRYRCTAPFSYCMCVEPQSYIGWRSGR